MSKRVVLNASAAQLSRGMPWLSYKIANSRSSNPLYKQSCDITGILDSLAIPTKRAPVQDGICHVPCYNRAIALPAECNIIELRIVAQLDRID